MKYSIDIQTRFCDLDGLGHINNSVYHSYIELCRVKWSQDILGFKPDGKNQNMPLILARTEIDFLHQGLLAYQLRVDSHISYVGTKSFHQHYEIMADKLCIVRAKAVLVWFDFENNKSAEIPDSMKKRILGKI